MSFVAGQGWLQSATSQADCYTRLTRKSPLPCLPPGYSLGCAPGRLLLLQALVLLRPLSTAMSPHPHNLPRSGAGKSTVAALLERLYSPDAGSITLAGQDIRGFTRTEWCAALAAVSQEPVLFPASIAYNIGGWLQRGAGLPSPARDRAAGWAWESTEWEAFPATRHRALCCRAMRQHCKPCS